MKTTLRNDAVLFSVKGQVVIPRWLRREYHIEEGTRAVVQATPEGILLKPVTKVSIQRMRGILKRKLGGKLFAQEWAEYKAGEKTLEEAKDARLAGSR